MMFLQDVMSALDGTSSTLVVTCTAVIVALSSFWLYSSVFNEQPARHSNGKLIRPIPYANFSMFQTIGEISGPDLASFFQQNVDELQTRVFRLSLPMPKVFVVGKASYQREILMDKSTDKPYEFYQAFDLLAGRSTIISFATHNQLWKSLRKGLAPAFSANQVSRMNEICQKHVRHWIDSTVEKDLVNHPDKTFDPAHAMTRLAFKTISEAAFEYDATDQECEDFRLWTDTALREFILRQTTNPFRKLFGPFIPEVRQAHAAANKFQAFGRRVLDAYKNNPNKSEANTLINLIENSAHNFSETQKATEIPMFMVAGQDTTGYTLTNILVLLAMHPHEMKKVRESLWREYIDNKEAAKKSNKTIPAHQSIRPSGYLRQVITEADRFLPVSTIGSIRSTGREYVLSVKECVEKKSSSNAANANAKTTNDDDAIYIIPKGSKVFLPQCLAHSDPAVFENADKFLPSRWDNPTKEMTQSVITFSAGVRGCAGQTLAMAELNSVLSLLFMKYELEVVEEGRLEYFLSLKRLGTKLRARHAPIPDFAKKYVEEVFGK
mmetsp:Transcript_16437/g.45865  ORF Transcript_16437/g.45865 Transcript_16437/m.45865 type:complete len:551 (-) Transcript_16437:106-1758(-)